MNLLADAWIPVISRHGRTELSGLEVLTRARDLLAFDIDSATVLAALLRQFLLPLVIAGSGGVPRSRREWRDRWAERAFAAEVARYAEGFSDRFELFDPVRPFAQVAGLHTSTNEEKPSSLLVPAESSGNNVPLFSARTEADPRSLPEGEAALRLLEAQCWDTAGIKSGAVGDPAVKGGKTTGAPVGPLGRLGVVILIGPNVFDTIMLNTPIIPDGLPPGDVPQWERAPAGPAWETRMPTGLLDQMTWQSRRIRLVPEDGPDGVVVRHVVVTAGDRMSAVPHVEPHTAWRVVPRPKPGEPPRRPLMHQSGRSAWRGLGAMLALDPEAGNPVAITSDLVRQYADMAGDELPLDYPLVVQTAGVEYGTQSAIVENTIEDVLPLPLAALLPDGLVGGLLRRMVSDTDELVRAVDLLDADLRRALGADPVPWDRGQRPGSRLVQMLDPHVRQILVVLQRHPDRVDRAIDAWSSTAQSCAFDIGDQLLAAVPPAAFAGRRRGEREPVHNVTTAEIFFRSRLRKIFETSDLSTMEAVR